MIVEGIPQMNMVFSNKPVPCWTPAISSSLHMLNILFLTVLGKKLAHLVLSASIRLMHP